MSIFNEAAPDLGRTALQMLTQSGQTRCIYRYNKAAFIVHC